MSNHARCGNKIRFVHGNRVVECNCGVWRDPYLPCFKSSDRKEQLMVEAIANLNQAWRNLGYQLLKAVGLVKGR